MRRPRRDRVLPHEPARAAHRHDLARRQPVNDHPVRATGLDPGGAQQSRRGRAPRAGGADRAGGKTLTAPNGTRIDLVHDGAGYDLPDNSPSLSIVRAPATDDDDRFGVGRAGMEYRDLLPDRWGGRFIASHIRIPGGGDVADSVHYHRIRFQLIFCARGWVDLVYEDQGPPFRLEAGDCVVQPPEIRHRVLHASEGLEVIEIGCPAVHDTFIEHDLALPTATVDGARSFGGQRFVRDVAACRPLGAVAARRPPVARPRAWRAPPMAWPASRVIRADVAGAIEPGGWLRHDGEFLFDVVLHGAAALVVDDGTGERVEHLGERDAVAIPPGMRWRWSDWSDDFELLDVTLPSNPVAIALADSVDPST